MPNRVRDVMTQPLTLEYVNRRTEEGWVLAAVEWIKADGPQAAHSGESDDEAPYGQRIAADCKHLVDDPIEMDTLYNIYEKVIAGWRPARIAEDLNARGRLTRAGAGWSANAVFDLMPRLIELAPKIQSRPDWPARRASLKIIA